MLLLKYLLLSAGIAMFVIAAGTEFSPTTPTC